jgi:dinuclear metal center YbgI/SA1388 family protein
MKISELLSYFNEIAPFAYQESYDNSGLQVGDMGMEIQGILLTIDVTEEIIEEAISKSLNLIISHHPLIFQGLKQLTDQTATERIVKKAVKHDINIISIHTNIDNIVGGVNSKISEKLGLQKTKILLPQEGKLLKLSVFVPESYADTVRESIFAAGAGRIGNYDSCSFNTSGSGTFRGNENASPFRGEKEKLHSEPEIKIETILPLHLKDKVVASMLNSHPYEEVAYDLYPLANLHSGGGSGMIGYLPETLSEKEFLLMLKEVFKSELIRYSAFTGRKIHKVALCGGSGSFLLKKAISSGAQAFISSDFKYHQFFDADGKILIADLGHYESEQYTKEYFYEVLIKKLPNFALHLSKINTNPINYI